MQQVAAAKVPQVLAPRRRKAVNYNEAKLHRKYVTDSESEATAAEAGSDADADGDDSNAEDTSQPKVSFSVLASVLCKLIDSLDNGQDTTFGMKDGVFRIVGHGWGPPDL